MDYFQSLARKSPIKCKNKRLSQDQIKLLETSFNFNSKLDADRKLQLSQELGIPPRQVAIWYQNKRARWKNQSLEEDHRAVQLKLETALADNKRLEREVETLKEELHKAQEMLLLFNTPYASSEEVGSSSLFTHDSKHHLDKELYACLIGGDPQFGKPSAHDFFAPPVS